MRRGNNPRLDIEITDEQLNRAIKSNSGGCLIADAIKAQYPNLSRVSVDMATIRVTDSARGVRYTYLTPQDAQHILLSFDQGWPIPIRKLTIRRAIHIAAAGASSPDAPSRREQRERTRARITELERREAAGEELTPIERGTLTRSRSLKARNKTTLGPRTVEILDDSPIVVGGRAPVVGDAHPNLLRSRNRHFGAKLADPGEAFRNAVDVAVEQRLRQMSSSSADQ